MKPYESFFTNREHYVIDQPDAQELLSLCCAVSGGKLWATDEYITDRYGYARMLLVYVNEGAMFLEYDGQKHVVEGSEAFFIDCDQHQVYGTHGKSCVLTFVHFMGGPSEYFFKKIFAKYGPVFKGYGAKIIKGCIYDVISVTKSHMKNKVERFSWLITQTLFNLLTHDAESDPLFEKAALMIRESVGQNTLVSVADVARETGYSKFYFTKRFTEWAGVSPYEFILRERVALAKNMLVNTSVPVGQIALECGFFDASHMTNCFKKREGMSPLKYRHDWKTTI